MSTAPQLVEIRRGAAADLPLVDAIMVQAFDPRYGEAWTPSQCLGMLSLPGVWMDLAWVADRPVGFALARAAVDEGELLLLAIAPAMRRRRIGTALLRAVIAEARDRGVRTLHLEVRANNEAIGLYRAEGFINVGARRDYYRGKDGKLFDAHSYSRVIG